MHSIDHDQFATSAILSSDRVSHSPMIGRATSRSTSPAITSVSRCLDKNQWNIHGQDCCELMYQFPNVEVSIHHIGNNIVFAIQQERCIHDSVQDQITTIIRMIRILRDLDMNTMSQQGVNKIWNHLLSCTESASVLWQVTGDR